MKADWKNLINLRLGFSVYYLGFNQIGENGCRYFVDDLWSNLTNLDLSSK